MSLAKIETIRRDPLYRWEVRRYWTARRYVWIAIILVVFAAIGAGCMGWSMWMALQMPGAADAPGLDLTGLLILIGMFVESACRLPLGVAAALAGAMALVDERTSGQIEQFVLTPLDPWRFALARLAGRLRGLANFWMVLGGLMAATMVALAFRGMPRAIGGIEGDTPLAMILAVLGWCDLALVLMLDVIVGMYYSARARSAAGAVIWSLLMSFVVLPIVLHAPAIALGIANIIGRLPGGQSEYAQLLQLAGTVAHAGLTLLFLKLWLSRLRRAVGRVFDDPEGGS